MAARSFESEDACVIYEEVGRRVPASVERRSRSAPESFCGVLECRFASAPNLAGVIGQSAFPPGPVAQLAEQQTLNLRVEGSIPSRLTILSSALSDGAK